MKQKRAEKGMGGSEGTRADSAGNERAGAGKPLANLLANQSDLALIADRRSGIANLFINHSAIFTREEFSALGKGDRKLLLGIMCARLMALSGELGRNGYLQTAQNAVEKWKASGLAIGTPAETKLFYEFKDEADRLLDITDNARAALENDKFMKVAAAMVKHYINSPLNLKYSDDAKGRQRADDALLIMGSYLRCESDRKFAKYLVEAMLAENLYGSLVARIREYK
jgi:hypothetical protein